MPNEYPEAALEDEANIQGEESADTPDEGGREEEQQTEKPLTRADVQRIADEISARNATRIAQSLVAKGENRITAKIQDQIRALNMNKDVLGLTPQQIEQARQKIVMDAYAEEPTGQEQASRSQSQVQQQPEAGIPVNVISAVKMMQDAGMIVEEGDPEFEQYIAPILNRNPNPGMEIVRATAKAMDAKENRLNAKKSKSPARAPQGGGNSEGGNAPAKSSSDYWNGAYRHKK